MRDGAAHPIGEPTARNTSGLKAFTTLSGRTDIAAASSLYPFKINQRIARKAVDGQAAEELLPSTIPVAAFAAV